MWFDWTNGANDLGWCFTQWLNDSSIDLWNSFHLGGESAQDPGGYGYNDYASYDGYGYNDHDHYGYDDGYGYNGYDGVGDESGGYDSYAGEDVGSSGG